MEDPRKLKIHAHFFAGLPDFDLWAWQGRYIGDEYLFRGLIKWKGTVCIGDVSLGFLESKPEPFPMERDKLWKPTAALPFIKNFVNGLPERFQVDGEVQGWIDYHDGLSTVESEKEASVNEKARENGSAPMEIEREDGSESWRDLGGFTEKEYREFMHGIMCANRIPSEPSSPQA